MVDEERVRLMTKLAMFEKKEEANSLRIAKYYRSDYIGLALLKNFFAATIAYGFVFAAVFVIDMDDIMDTLNNLDFQPLIVNTIIGYIVFLLLYSLLTYILAAIRYRAAKKKTEQYEEALGRLQKTYEKGHKTSHAERARGAKG